MSTVLLLAKLAPQSGNKITAERIRSYLVEHGYLCQLQNTMTIKDIESFRGQLVLKNIQCIIGIHLWRAGKFLIDCSVPFVMIFGGTDLNEHCKRRNELKIMTQVVKQAKNLIAFSHTMACQAKEFWPDIESKLIIQPQAVHTNPSRFSENDLINRMKEYASPEEKLSLENVVEKSMLLFLLVAGLRPVKDPMFLFETLSEWHKEDDKVYFVVIGPELDAEFSKQVKMGAKRYPGVLVLPALDQNDLHAVIKYSTTAVVNSSLSEGMASSILEALDLETVVCARNNPGNASLIQHNKNGLLFNSAEEFLFLAKELVSSKEKYSQLTLCGKEFITRHHSVEIEKNTYCSIIKNILEK